MQSTPYRAVTDIVSRKNQDGTIIIMKMDDTNNFYKVNGIAAEIWNQITKAESIESIKNDIVKTYDVSHDKLNQDVDALLVTLIEKKLIEKC